MKIIERMIMISQLIGMLISGSLPERVVCFERLFIMIMIIPVMPPEMTPPILRTEEKVRSLNSVTRM